MSKVKKFIEGSDHDTVKQCDILKHGDWVLKWSPDAKDDTTGFALYHPLDFDPERGGGPLGGLVLAAVYFIMEHGEPDFCKELIAKANELSKQVAEEARQEGLNSNISTSKVLN